MNVQILSKQIPSQLLFIETTSSGLPYWQKEASDYEDYAPIALVSGDGSRFCEPVRVPGVPGAFERAHVHQKIKGKKNIKVIKLFKLKQKKWD